jgi:hypothetical protein
MVTVTGNYLLNSLASPAPAEQDLTGIGCKKACQMPSATL